MTTSDHSILVPLYFKKVPEGGLLLLVNPSDSKEPSDLAVKKLLLL